MSSFIKSMPSDEKIKALASNDLKDANENNIDDIELKVKNFITRLERIVSHEIELKRVDIKKEKALAEEAEKLKIKIENKKIREVEKKRKKERLDLSTMTDHDLNKPSYHYHCPYCCGQISYGEWYDLPGTFPSKETWKREYNHYKLIKDFISCLTQEQIKDVTEGIRTMICSQRYWKNRKYIDEMSGSLRDITETSDLGYPDRIDYGEPEEDCIFWCWRVYLINDVIREDISLEKSQDSKLKRLLEKIQTKVIKAGEVKNGYVDVDLTYDQKNEYYEHYVSHQQKNSRSKELMAPHFRCNEADLESVRESRKLNKKSLLPEIITLAKMDDSKLRDLYKTEFNITQTSPLYIAMGKKNQTRLISEIIEKRHPGVYASTVIGWIKSSRLE